MKLVDSKTMKELDRRAETEYGVKPLVLMENAGRGVADVVGALCKALGGARVAVVAGSGNNGGDGFVAARHLENSGHDVTVYSIADVADIKGEAGANARIWTGSGGETITIKTAKEFTSKASALKHADVIVDCLLGTGLSSDVKGFYATIIDFINSLEKPVVAVDVPSGIDASSGKVLGSAVHAEVTATMALAKLGLFVNRGKEYAGRVEVIDIGMPRVLLREARTGWELIDRALVGRLIKPRADDSHKGSYGHVVVLAGSPGKTGAAYMTAVGAMRAGAGLTTVGLPESLNPVMEAKTTEVMTYPLAETDGKTLGVCSYGQTERLLGGKDAVVIGPGIGVSDMLPFIVKVVKRASEIGIPVVIDADGLNALDGQVEVIKGCGSNVVLTPHPGEMARLLGTTTARVQADRLSSALELTERSGCTVVLKGAGTIITSPAGTQGNGNEPGYINPTGNPGMATAGTGDVLAGMMGGLIAQGLSIVDASVAAVFIHGLAGDEVAKDRGIAGIIATDILNAVPAIMNSLAPGHSR